MANILKHVNVLNVTHIYWEAVITSEFFKLSSHIYRSGKIEAKVCALEFNNYACYCVPLFSFFLQNTKFKDASSLNKARSQRNRRGSAGKTPRTHDLRSRWTCVVNFRVRLFCPGEWTRFCLNRTRVLLRVGLSDVKRRKNFLLSRTATSPDLQSVSYSM